MLPNKYLNKDELWKLEMLFTKEYIQEYVRKHNSVVTDVFIEELFKNAFTTKKVKNTTESYPINKAINSPIQTL